jgi:2-methylcitrate dehydratase PrpD
MALTKKIETHLDPSLAGGRLELAARVQLDVRLHDGRTFSCSKDHPSGFPPGGMSEAEHLRHFHENMAYGGLPLAPANIAGVLAMVQDLENLADVRDIVPLMTSAAPERLSA